MIFDGDQQFIILEASDGDVIDVVDIYDAFVVWQSIPGNEMFTGAFTTAGGTQLEQNLYIDTHYRLAGGWLIRPREANHTLTIRGNLFSQLIGGIMFVATLGGYTVPVRLYGGMHSRVVVLAAPDTDVIADAVWGHADVVTATEVSDAVWEHADAVALAASVSLIRKITDNRLEVDITRQLLVLYDDDGVSELRTWALATDQGEDVETSAGVQTRRSIPEGLLLGLSGDEDGFTFGFSGDESEFEFAYSGDAGV